MRGIIYIYILALLFVALAIILLRNQAAVSIEHIDSPVSELADIDVHEIDRTDVSRDMSVIADSSLLSTSGVTNMVDYAEPAAMESSESIDPQAIPGERLLRFSDGSDLSAFLALAGENGVEVVDVISKLNTVRIKFDDEGLLGELLKSAPSPEEQAGNYYVRLPDDPAQIPLQPAGGYVGFGANSLLWLGVDDHNESWGDGVVVAVLDTGIADHPVLEKLNIERKILALDAAGAADGQLTLHGTAMASLIAGSGSGVKGLAPGASILSLDVMGADGVSDSFTLAKGIYQAVDMGARVINISMGSQGDSFVLKSAVDYAEANDVVVVASTGNDAIEGVLYPARYDSVVAVSGVDAVGRHLYFANRGDEVDISAPALSILAAGDDGGVSSVSGTSASAAFVSGTLAWMFSEEPDMTSAEAVSILLGNANDVGEPGKDDRSGEGVLSIERIRDRKTAGIYDIAVCNPFVKRDENGNAVVTLFVENRGTEPISKVEFTGVVGGSDYYVDYYNLQVGAVESYDVLLGSSQMRADDGVKVDCMAVIDGVSDSRPINNVVSGTILSGQ